MGKILIVEDDLDIATLIEIHLKDMGYQIESCHDGLSGLEAALNGEYALIILDIMLPGMDGFEICKRIRQEKNESPVLMLTARSEELDKVLGLEIGADDYLTKPFSVRELSARVKAIIRRSKTREEQEYQQQAKVISLFGLFIDVDKRLVKVHGEKKDLTPKEFDLLVLLAGNAGKTYSREQLLSLIWGYEFDGFEHTVNSHINRLRTKIEENVQSPEFILTTWGVGYRFKDNS